MIFFENVNFGSGRESRDLKEDVVWPRQIILERTQWVKNKNMYTNTQHGNGEAKI